ncbi:MAG: hypothetical protein ABI650_09015, partial [Dokdonella sp.]
MSEPPIPVPPRRRAPAVKKDAEPPASAARTTASAETLAEPTSSVPARVRSPAVRKTVGKPTPAADAAR